MKKLVLALLACFLLLSGCSAEEPVLGTAAEYEDCAVELLDAEFFQSDDGAQMVRVYVKYTNSGAEDMYMLESFALKAFQGDTQLLDCTDINEETALIQNVKDGNSTQGGYVYQLVTDDPVVVKVFTPTADEELLALREYSNK